MVLLRFLPCFYRLPVSMKEAALNFIELPSLDPPICLPQYSAFITGANMAEFYGTDFQIAVQKRMLTRHNWIKNTPGIANGGRILNFLEPDKTGWDNIGVYLKEDGAIALTAQNKDGLVARVRDFFGPEYTYPRWDVYLGDAETVLQRSRDCLAHSNIPPGWKLECLDCPNALQLEAIQALNQDTGVAPYPGFYVRGEVVPTMTGCLWDQDGALVASSSVNARYHPASRFGGYIFMGSISVDPKHQGCSLGKFVSAQVLIDSHAAMNWTNGLSQVAPDNPASLKTIGALGFVRQKDLMTIAVIAQGHIFNR